MYLSYEPCMYAWLCGRGELMGKSKRNGRATCPAVGPSLARPAGRASAVMALGRHADDAADERLLSELRVQAALATASFVSAQQAESEAKEALAAANAARWPFGRGDSSLGAHILLL